MTRITRICADNKIKIRVNLRYPRHLRSNYACTIELSRQAMIIIIVIISIC